MIQGKFSSFAGDLIFFTLRYVFSILWLSMTLSPYRDKKKKHKKTGSEPSGHSSEFIPYLT